MTRRTVSALFALLLTVSMTAALLTPRAYAATTEQEQLSEIEAKKAELQKQIDAAENSKTAVLDQKKLMDEQNDVIRQQISTVQSQIEDSNQRIAETQVKEEAQYQLFCKQVREEEERGTISYWEVLFKATSFSDLLSRLDFINEVMAYDKQVMVIKSGRFGRFLACPGYPECKFTKPLVVEMPGRCPKCGGRLMKRVSTSKRTGKPYTYYCCEHTNSADPAAKCDFMTFDVPVKDDCPVCGHTLFKKSGRGFKKPFCINPECANFLPEDKRGYPRKKTEDEVSGTAAADASAQSGETEGTVKKPAAKKATAKKTAAKKKTSKAAEKAADTVMEEGGAPEKKPAAKKTSAKKPAAKKPTDKKPTAKKPAAKRASTKKETETEE